MGGGRRIVRVRMVGIFKTTDDLLAVFVGVPYGHSDCYFFKLTYGS
jgi:hypothetical protein